MPVRKEHQKKQKESRETPRFTADDIVRAIEAVEQTGLMIHGVEITLDGSIKINTTSPFKHDAASKPERSADEQKDIRPNKRRA